MMDKNKLVRGKIQKRSLISAIIGIAIALFTIICCGLLVPLGLFTAAAFLHQWRIPLIILGVATALISVFFMLRGKEIICFCKGSDLIKKYKQSLNFSLRSKYKKLAVISTGIIVCIGLVVFLSSNFFTTPTENPTNAVISEPTVSEWKSGKVESGLVELVNFLKRNIGKEIVLDGETHLATGKEMIGIKVVMLECCTKEEFDDIIKQISVNGEVKNSDFDKKEIWAEVTVNEIPKIADIWNVEAISLEPDAKILWKSIINQKDF